MNYDSALTIAISMREEAIQLSLLSGSTDYLDDLADAIERGLTEKDNLKRAMNIRCCYLFDYVKAAAKATVKREEERGDLEQMVQGIMCPDKSDVEI